MLKWIKAKLWQFKVDRWLKQGKAKPIGINCIVGPDGHIHKHDLSKYCEFTSPFVNDAPPMLPKFRLSIKRGF